MQALAVIIVNWNTRDLLRGCLTSIDAQLPHADRQIVVVDNDSEDGSADMVAAEFAAVTVIRCDSNLGFARANNRGVAATQSRHALLLNSDTLASTAALDALVRAMDADTALGALSPLLRTPDGGAQPYAFGADPTPAYLLRRGVNRLLFKRPLHDWAPTVPIDADWVSGACMALRREAFERVGGLDERVFMYFEDTDLCLRIRRAGWRVRYDPRIAITHIGGQSLKRNPAARRAYRESLSYFYAKHYGPLSQLALRAMLPLYARMSS